MLYKKNTNRRKRLPVLRLAAGLLVVVVIATMIGLVLQPGHAKAAITLVNKTTVSGNPVTSQAVTVPTGTAAGNVIIAQLSYYRNGTSATLTVPTGWTQISSSITSGNGHAGVYYIVYPSGGPSSYTWTFSRQVYVELGNVTYSGVNTTNVTDVINNQSNASSTTQTAPAVNTTNANDMVIALFTYVSASTASTFTAGLASLWQASNTNVGYFGGYESFINTGSTGTFQTTTTIATTSIGFTVALLPAGATAGVHLFGTDTPTMCSGCSSQTAAVPAGYSTGDFLLASTSWNTKTSTLTAPTGWTQINTTITGTGNPYALAEFYHFVANGDPNSYTWSFSASTGAITAMSDYTGVDPLNPIDASANAADGSSVTTHILPSITTTYPDDLLVGIWGYANNITTTAFPGSMTTAWNVKNGVSDGTSSAVVTLGSAGTIGSYAATSASDNSLKHSIAIKADRPIPQLISPLNNHTDDILSPSLRVVNASIAGTPLQYKIQICSNITCGTVLYTYDQTLSQSGWSGQDALSRTAYAGSNSISSSTIATLNPATSLSPGTIYYWRVYSYDTGTSETSLSSNINKFTTSYLPSAPTLYAPTSNQINVPSKTEFQLAAIDVDVDPLEYKILICADLACSSILYTINQISSQTGWSGQDALILNAYSSDASSAANSSLAYYNFTSGQLTPGTLYYWQAFAIDPTGSNTFGPGSTIQAFTINTSETRIMNGTIENSTIL